jgi:hypothetical protein
MAFQEGSGDAPSDHSLSAGNLHMYCAHAKARLVGEGVICFFLQRMFLLRPSIPARHWLPVLFGRIWLRLFPGNPQKQRHGVALPGRKKALLTRKEEPI